MVEQPKKRPVGRPRGPRTLGTRAMVPIDKSKLGPKMQALPNDAWRAAAIARFMVKPGMGGNTAAARAAGFCAGSTSRHSLVTSAYTIFHDERMLAALHELGEQYLKDGVPDALMVVKEIMADADAGARDRLTAAKVFIDRAHPLTTHSHVTVEHIDHDAEAVEHLRYMKAAGTPREGLEKIFGVNGVTRYERLLAQEDARRADKAKVVNAEVSP